MEHHVLVIDPERGFGGLIRDTLQNLPGLQASLAASEAEAEVVLQEKDVGLVIVDFSSADLDASDLVGRLREDSPDMAVLGLPREEALEACRAARLEIDGVLPVPFYLPDVVQLVAQVLKLPLNPHDVHPGRLAAGGPSEPGSVSAPAWLRDKESAQARLNRSFDETSARALMLTFANGEHAICGDLSQGQMADLQAMIDHQTSGKSQRGALARYVDLPESPESHLLFSTVIHSGVVLSLVYPAEVPFGTARQDARRLSQELLHHDPEHGVPSPEVAEGPSDPDRPPSPPAEALQAFEEAILDGLDLPSPKPERDREARPDPAGEPSTSVERSTVVHIPTSDPENKDGERPTGRTRQAANRSSASQTSVDEAEETTATFTVVLIPRSAKYRLTGSLAQSALEATLEHCQARSWLAQDVQLDERYLRLTVQLPADRSPTGAVQDIRRATSRTLLQRLPELSNHLPARQFWNRRYLLQPGTTVDPNKIALLREQAYA
jgi:DNA-binding NarL/FixJ family response regulator/REP element-mobilizing transposase RayT